MATPHRNTKMISLKDKHCKKEVAMQQWMLEAKQNYVDRVFMPPLHVIVHDASAPPFLQIIYHLFQQLHANHSL